MDSDGYFWYHGRTDDLIISSGYKISAVEVEMALMSHPKVSASAVIGSTNREPGEIVKAIVVPPSSAEPKNVRRREPQYSATRPTATSKSPQPLDFFTY